jgi:hypothetical protein
MLQVNEALNSEEAAQLQDLFVRGDRLRRLHAMGLNTVQTYVPWNFHSQAPGVYDFTGPRDIVAFIKAVQAEGLILNLRAGPYIVSSNANPPAHQKPTPQKNKPEPKPYHPLNPNQQGRTWATCPSSPSAGRTRRAWWTSCARWA